MTRRPSPENEPYTGETLPMPAVPTRDLPRSQPARKGAGTPGASPRRASLVPPRARRDWRRILARLGMAAVVLLLLACVGLLVLQQQVARAVALRDVRANRPVAKPLLTPMNVLLLGVDSRPDHPEEGIRSDSLLLLRIDPVGGWANLLAIPRDSLVDVPGSGALKINAAFSHGYDEAVERYGDESEPMAGGAGLAAETVEHFLQLRDLGTRVDYIATINFDGFAGMIDALGGIEVDVPRTIVDDEYPTPDFGTMRVEFQAGRQTLNGERALQYVRTRHADSDFGRAERQQQVVSAMVARVRGQAPPMQLVAGLRLLHASSAAIRTTLPVGRPDALLLGMFLLRLQPDEIGQLRIDPTRVPLVAEQGTNLVWDTAGVQAVAREALRRPAETPEEAVVQVINGAGVTGLAGRVSSMLAAEGFSVAEPATGDPVQRSRLLDYTGKPRTRERLRRLLGSVPVEERSPAEAPPGVDLMVLLGDDHERFIPDR